MINKLMLIILLITGAFNTGLYSYSLSVNNTIIENYPIEKKKKKKKQKKKKKLKKKINGDITRNLIITIITLITLPLFVIIGSVLLASFLSNFAIIITGIALLLIGNITTIIAGFTAGSNKYYNTQILTFASYVFFILNFLGGSTLLMLFIFMVPMTIILVISITMIILSIFFLIWAILNSKSNAKLKKEEE